MSTEFDPYEWHEHPKPGKPRWRVKAGMAEKRLALIGELQKINDEMLERESFRLVDRCDEVHQAILDCEEQQNPLADPNNWELVYAEDRDEHVWAYTGPEAQPWKLLEGY